MVEDGELAAKYSLAKIVKTEPSERGGLVYTVAPAALPKDALKKMENHDDAKRRLEPVAAQDLVPPTTARGVEERFAKFSARGADDCHELEGAIPLGDEVTDPDGILDG